MSDYFEKFSDLKEGWHVVLLKDHWCGKIMLPGREEYLASQIPIGTLCRVIVMHDGVFDLVEEKDIGKGWRFEKVDGRTCCDVCLYDKSVKVLGDEGYKNYCELWESHKRLSAPAELCSKCGRMLHSDEYEIGHCPGGCLDGVEVYRMEEHIVETPTGDYKDYYKVFVTNGNGGRGYPVKDMGKNKEKKSVLIITDEQYRNGDY